MQYDIVPLMLQKKGKPIEFLHVIINKENTNNFKLKQNFEHDFEEVNYKNNILETILKTNESTKSHEKRSINGKPISLYIEYLVVVDRSAFMKYKNLYSQFDDELLIEYLKIHYSQVVNAVNIKKTCMSILK